MEQFFDGTVGNIAADSFGTELVHRGVGHNFAAVDDDDAAAHRLHLLHDVRGEQHYLVFADRAYQAAYLFQLVGVEACGRLVEYEHLRVVEINAWAKPTRCL